MRDFNKNIPLWSRGGFLWLCSVINHTWLNKLFAAWFDSYQPDSFQRLHLNYNSNSNQCIFWFPLIHVALSPLKRCCIFLCFPNHLEKVVELSTSDGLQSNLRRGRKRWELQLMVLPPPQNSCNKIISRGKHCTGIYTGHGREQCEEWNEWELQLMVLRLLPHHQKNLEVLDTSCWTIWYFYAFAALRHQQLGPRRPEHQMARAPWGAPPVPDGTNWRPKCPKI